MQLEDLKKLIYDPTQELVDDSLYELNLMVADCNEALEKYETYKQAYESAVDELLNSEKEKQKTKAEARIKEETDLYAQYKDSSTQYKSKENNKDMMKMNYYH
tara:strand:+ start:263 stop:571 length:309 start_codon:yes stop_codon:yes gene_type:complete